MFSDVAKYWKQYKTTKLIKVKRIASIWCQNDKNNSKLHTRSNYYQFASIWRQNNQKHWGTVAKHSKQRKTTKLIKLQWIDSIGCQNDQNNSKLQTRSNYEQFASIWRQNDKKVQWRRKIFKTMQNYITDQITMNCFYLMSKR